ncbi:hypothetical protein LptCag_2617 [Leptospirillum ferriphilum]|uniref:Uncharacterized protein n=1 Tax=Leptospirillum ferriphilum TaxID=178606 RepID=A0A094WCA5_9BACT|nr:hypothetical protein LptCag_2617 [Leptospirillum ferriphilum]
MGEQGYPSPERTSRNGAGRIENAVRTGWKDWKRRDGPSGRDPKGPSQKNRVIRLSRSTRKDGHDPLLFLTDRPQTP